MEIDKLTFITPLDKLSQTKVVLEKSYSQEYSLPTNSVLSISSDIGKRENQQDSVAITEKNGYLLLLVSDGVGGMQSGEIASYETAKIIQKWFSSEDNNTLKTLNEKTFEDVLTALMYLISTRIPENSGATLNMSIIGPTETLIANIGDSRTYTIKNNRITLRTYDDSLVFKKLKPKTPQERNRLRFHINKNVITNSITSSSFPTITITKINNNDYDTICHLTDGVTDFLSEKLILMHSKCEHPAIELVNRSTKGKPIYNKHRHSNENTSIYPGEDNATAIVYRKKINR